MNNVDFMKAAINITRQGISEGQAPFGAAIAFHGELVTVAHNTVWADTDITAHAEVNAIRDACKKLGKIDLSHCEIFSTTEPCPMCFSAIHWARIHRITYGTSIQDATRFGFNELEIPDLTMESLSGSRIELISGYMKEECIKLFEEWVERKDKRTY
ncbi:MAG: nucleoside deaminase [Candidatus Altiarchaeota archaeon]